MHRSQNAELDLQEFQLRWSTQPQERRRILPPPNGPDGRACSRTSTVLWTGRVMRRYRSLGRWTQSVLCQYSELQTYSELGSGAGPTGHDLRDPCQRVSIRCHRPTDRRVPPERIYELVLPVGCTSTGSWCGGPCRKRILQSLLFPQDAAFSSRSESIEGFCPGAERSGWVSVSDHYLLVGHRGSYDEVQFWHF